MGSQLASLLAPIAPAAPRFSLVDEIAVPLTPLQRVLPSGATGPSPFEVLTLISVLAVWSLGCAVVFVYSWHRWWRVRAIVRRSTPLEAGRFAAKALGIGLVSSESALEPGVFGILRPVLYLPADIVNNLSDAELDAILSHELCHTRRRDNLTAALHLVVEGLFWFHPLVWWMGARLIEERERACDEEVLRLGIEPSVYAEGILQVCTRCLQSPSVCVAGVTGASLKKRIEEIMTNRITMRLSSRRRLLLAGGAVLAVMVPVVTGVISGPRLRAQPSRFEIVAAPSGPRFAVASIKPAPITSGGPPANAGIKIDGGRVDIGYWSIKQLILRAYGIPDYQLSAPGWVADLRFDVAAKFPEEAGRDQLPEMLKWLMADRFGLAAHAESRELAGFALVLGKGGLKMKPAVRDAYTPLNRNRRTAWSVGGRFSTVSSVTMAMRLEQVPIT